MNGGCFKPDEFEGLEADDPRRVHLEKCLRCRSVLKSFEVFRNVADIPDEADVPDGADVVEAHARLSVALEGEIGAGKFGEPAGEEAQRTPSFWGRLRGRMGGN